MNGKGRISTESLRIGAKLRLARLESGRSLSEVARISGLEEDEILSFERGEKEIEWENHLFFLCSAVNKPGEYFID